MSGVGDFLNDVRLIIQSNPDALNQFAAQWQTISGTLSAQGTVIDRALGTAQADALGATASHLIAYRTQMTTGVSSLATGSNSVAAALREVVPKITKLKQDVESLVLAAVLAVGALAVPESAPATIATALKFMSGSVSIMNVINLVNDYHVAMETLATALNKASSDFMTLDALQQAGGVLPAAPHLTP